MADNYLVSLKGRSGLYAQRAVPKDLQSRLGTKLWRKKAGNTLPEARRFLVGFLAETEALIAQCRGESLGEAKPIRLTREQELLHARGRSTDELFEFWPSIPVDQIEAVSKLPAVPLLTAEEMIAKAITLKKPAAGTIREWTNCFKHFTTITGNKFPLSATKEEAILVRDELLATQKASTTKKIIRYLRSHWQIAIDEQLITSNVWDGVIRHVKTDERKEKVLNHAKADQLAADLQPEHQLLYWTLRFTGMRIQEALGLKVRDLDLNNRTITVADNEYRGLGGGIKNQASRRTIPINTTLMNHIESLGINNNDPEALVFPFGLSKTGNLTTPRFFNSKLQITPHQLRHHITTSLREHGVNETVCGALLGHAPSGGITSSYGTVTLQAMRDALEKLT